MSIYDRIALSGEQNYENIRQGFYQRPEEVRANKLADLQLSNAEMKSREYRQAAPSRQLTRKAGDYKNRADIAQAEETKRYLQHAAQADTTDPDAFIAGLYDNGFTTQADALKEKRIEQKSKIAKMSKDNQEAIKLSAEQTFNQLAADPNVDFNRYKAWKNANPSLGAAEMPPGQSSDAYKSEMEFWAGNAAGKKPQDVINLVLPSGEKRGFQKGDSRIPEWLDRGAVRVGLGVQSGKIDDLGITIKTKGDIEKKLFNTQEGLSRLSSIRNKLDAKFLEIPEKIKTAYLAGKEKLGFELDENEIKSVEAMSKFKRSAASNINLYIKEITGAQMSEAEVGRLKRAVPDPGAGLFDGDSYTVFKAKLDDVYDELVAADKRLQFLRKNGFSGDITEDIANRYPLSEFKDSVDLGPAVATDSNGKEVFLKNGKYIYSDGTEYQP